MPFVIQIAAIIEAKHATPPQEIFSSDASNQVMVCRNSTHFCYRCFNTFFSNHILNQHSLFVSWFIVSHAISNRLD